MHEQHHFKIEELVLLSMIVDLHEIVDKTPNDQVLGRIVRKLFQEFDELWKYVKRITGLQRVNVKYAGITCH